MIRRPGLPVAVTWFAALAMSAPTRSGAEGVAAGFSPGQVTAAKPVFVTLADANWSSIAAGLQIAPLYGERAAGPHGEFIKLRAGAAIPLHTHSSSERTVVVSGTYYIGADASSSKELPPGTYFTTPAGLAHVAGCRAGADCVLYNEMDGKSDIQFLGERAGASSSSTTPRSAATDHSGR